MSGQHVVNRSARAALFLIIVMLLSLAPMSYHGGISALQEAPSPNHVSTQMYDYQIYVAQPNSTAGGDGFLTTQEPSSGGQKNIVVSEETASKFYSKQLE